jgi:flagellar biosynthesis component FlhA
MVAEGEALGGTAAPITQEADWLAGFIDRVGMPTLILLALAVFFVRYIWPRWTTMKEKEQEAFAKRQEAYDAQAKSMTEIATRTEIALGDSTKVISENTKAFAANTEILKRLVDDMDKHDARAEQMNLGITQVLEHVRKEG